MRFSTFFGDRGDKLTSCRHDWNPELKEWVPDPVKITERAKEREEERRQQAEEERQRNQDEERQKSETDES